MRLAKDSQVDELAGTSKNAIPVLDRTLVAPLIGSLILDGSTVYYGDGHAWKTVSATPVPTTRRFITTQNATGSFGNGVAGSSTVFWRATETGTSGHCVVSCTLASSASGISGVLFGGAGSLPVDSLGSLGPGVPWCTTIGFGSGIGTANLTVSVNADGSFTVQGTVPNGGGYR